MVGVFEELHNPVLFGERFELCDDPSQLPVNNEWDLNVGVSPRGQYRLSEGFSPRLLLAVVMSQWGCEYLAERLYPTLDVSDLICISGGLLQDTASSGQGYTLGGTHIIVLQKNRERTHADLQRQ
jgi:hypothetical protein